MRSIALAMVAATVLALALLIPNACIAGGAEPQVCDVNADYSLGVEDYPEAIRLHIAIVRKHPDNALAHYHLGFALGMVGYKAAEIKEYHRAAALGLKSWDLFLNLGLASLEDGDLNAAADSIRRAVILGEDHPESHFNLALVDAQRGMLAEAEHEARESLILNPGQQDARNLLAVIHARQGETGTSPSASNASAEQRSGDSGGDAARRFHTSPTSRGKRTLQFPGLPPVGGLSTGSPPAGYSGPNQTSVGVDSTTTGTPSNCDGTLPSTSGMLSGLSTNTAIPSASCSATNMTCTSVT